MQEEDSVKISVSSGFIRKSDDFEICYTTPNGTGLPFCIMPNSGTVLTILRSPSGSGKSTLLDYFVRCLRTNSSGDLKQLSFQVSMKNGMTPQYAIGKVPQNPSWVSHWKAAELLTDEKWSAKAAFNGIDLEDFTDRLLGTMSGGQQRRVYACSVLERLGSVFSEGAILVLDETLDGLGTNGAGEFIDAISSAWSTRSDSPLCIVLVTHLPRINSQVSVTNSLTLLITSESTKRISVDLGLE